MASFISCDWGTSTFRMRMIDQPTGACLAEIKDTQGIAATHEKWRQSGDPDRLAYYQSVLLQQIRRMGSRATDLPLIISGMASATIGMMELPYKELPFSTDGRDLTRVDLPPMPAFPHPLTLISGVRSADDVMRGEETLLIGAAPERTGSSLFIFPGTHSKHVFIQNSTVKGFKTYMTGEFFSLLAQHSILAGSLTPAATALSGSFEKGVEDSRTASILHRAFGVRTNQLFDRLSKEENYHYLSGLLIGTELNELTSEAAPSGTTHLSPLTLVAGGHLKEAYTRALHQLGHTGFSIIDDSQALIAAHRKILNFAG